MQRVRINDVVVTVDEGRWSGDLRWAPWLQTIPDMAYGDDRDRAELARDLTGGELLDPLPAHNDVVES